MPLFIVTFAVPENVEDVVVNRPLLKKNVDPFPTANVESVDVEAVLNVALVNVASPATRFAPARTEKIPCELPSKPPETVNVRPDGTVYSAPC